MTDQPSQRTDRAGDESHGPTDARRPTADEGTIALGVRRLSRQAPIRGDALEGEPIGGGLAGIPDPGAPEEEAVARLRSQPSGDAAVPERRSDAAEDEGDRTVILDRGRASAEDDLDATVMAPAISVRPRVTMRDATGAEREFPLLNPEVTIGRASTCDIVLAAPNVSRLHARISHQAGADVLVAVSTHHNTYVNSELISRPRLLKDGDCIQLAGEQLVYRVAETSGRAAPLHRHLGIVVAAVTVIGLALVVLFLTRPMRPTPADHRAAAEGTGAAASAAAPNVAANPQEAPAEQSAQLAAQRAALEDQERQRAAEQERQRAAEQERQRAAEQERQQAEAAAQERQERIEKLLYQGDIALLEHRYTTPTESSAAYAYREALKLDPTNERALGQMAKIVDDYLAWAERAVKGGQRRQARLYTEKAAYVHQQAPAAGDAARVDSRLGQLRQSLGLGE